MMLMTAAVLASLVKDRPNTHEIELPTLTITMPKPKQQSPYQFTVIRNADDGLIVLSI